MQWPEETNAIAEGVECDGRRRQIRRQKESKASHNFRYSIAALSALYIFWFLHQTTTFAAWGRKMKGCISFESYIKPQRWSDGSFKLPVVYLLNPTSNHNTMVGFAAVMALYIFWILHQTTTKKLDTRKDELLYIFWILHQTTTGIRHSFNFVRCISFESYIKPQLRMLTETSIRRCISFESYLKPRPQLEATINKLGCISFESYIKPQPLFDHTSDRQGCISFESYIKPQLWKI